MPQVWFSLATKIYATAFIEINIIFSVCTKNSWTVNNIKIRIVVILKLKTKLRFILNYYFFNFSVYLQTKESK